MTGGCRDDRGGHVGASALVAVVFGEPERGAFVQRMESAERVLVSAVTVVETRMVVSGRRGPRGVVLLDELLRLPMIEVASVGVAEMNAAYAAFVLYGRGSGHPAALNFGDVFSFARQRHHDAVVASIAQRQRRGCLERVETVAWHCPCQTQQKCLFLSP